MNRCNKAPSFQDKARQSPLKIFSRSKIAPNYKHWISFGTLAYVLETRLQDKQPFHKWAGRLCIGLYVCRSPLHARNVALILDIDKGYVLLQFHVQHNHKCQSLKFYKSPCHWQQKFNIEGSTTTPTTSEEPTTDACTRKQKQALPRTNRNVIVEQPMVASPLTTDQHEAGDPDHTAQQSPIKPQQRVNLKTAPAHTGSSNQLPLRCLQRIKEMITRLTQGDL